MSQDFIDQSMSMKVGFFGADGLLGSKLVEPLQKNFDLKIFRRESDGSYGSKDEPIKQMQGLDGVVSAVSALVVDIQKILLEAAIEAGVKVLLSL
jgi:hypothetical protein